MSDGKRVEWLWYGQDEKGGVHVSFGQWKKHECQHRYKYADPQYVADGEANSVGS